MAQYTVELNEFVKIENNEISTVFTDFLASYPIFDENYRDELNKKIVKHYYFHEIGFETAERFVFEINRKMDEIMVMHNQRYESEININPLINYRKITNVSENVTDNENETINKIIDDTLNDVLNRATNDSETESVNTTGTRDDSMQNNNVANKNRSQTVSGEQVTNNQNTVNNTTSTKDVKSDTPTSLILDGEIEGDIYASEASLNDVANNTDQSTLQNVNETQSDTVDETDTSTQSQTTKSDLTSDTEKTNDKLSSVDETRSNTRNSETDENRENNKTSNKVSYINDEGITISESELLLKYRETFINIDMDIINSLKTLFMVIV